GGHGGGRRGKSLRFTHPARVGRFTPLSRHSREVPVTGVGAWVARSGARGFPGAREATVDPRRRVRRPGSTLNRGRGVGRVSAPNQARVFLELRWARW